MNAAQKKNMSEEKLGRSRHNEVPRLTVDFSVLFVGQQKSQILLSINHVN